MEKTRLKLRHAYPISRVFLGAMLASLGLVVAAQDLGRIPKDTGICDRIYAEDAHTPSDLRAIMDRCGWDTDGFVLALRKLNSLPPPGDLKRITLKPRVDGARSLRAVYDIDVFFDLLQAYPHPLAFGKLEQLVDRMSSGYEIGRIEITGYSDINEREELPGMALDSKRADFMLRYFQAVGISRDLITVTTAAPRHDNSAALGRARDRSVAVKVHTLRQD